MTRKFEGIVENVEPRSATAAMNQVSSFPAPHFLVAPLPDFPIFLPAIFLPYLSLPDTNDPDPSKASRWMTLSEAPTASIITMSSLKM